MHAAGKLFETSRIRPKLPLQGRRSKRRVVDITSPFANCKSYESFPDLIVFGHSIRYLKLYIRYLPGQNAGKCLTDAIQDSTHHTVLGTYGIAV